MKLSNTAEPRFVSSDFHNWFCFQHFKWCINTQKSQNLAIYIGKVITQTLKFPPFHQERSVLWNYLRRMLAWLFTQFGYISKKFYWFSGLRLLAHTSGLIFKKYPFPKSHLHLITLSRVRSQGMIDYIPWFLDLKFMIKIMFNPH